MHYAPRALSRVLPSDQTFLLGCGGFVLGTLGACYAVYVTRDPALFLASLIQCFAATWFMLAPSADRRGDPDDAPMMRNLATMLGSGVAVLLVSLYVNHQAAEAALQLWLILFGAAVALRPRLWSQPLAWRQRLRRPH